MCFEETWGGSGVLHWRPQDILAFPGPTVSASLGRHCFSHTHTHTVLGVMSPYKCQAFHIGHFITQRPHRGANGSANLKWKEEGINYTTDGELGSQKRQP